MPDLESEDKYYQKDMMSLEGSEWDSEFRKVDALIEFGKKLMNVHLTADSEEKADLYTSMEQCQAKMNQIQKDRLQHSRAVAKVRAQLDENPSDGSRKTVDVRKVTKEKSQYLQCSLSNVQCIFCI